MKFDIESGLPSLPPFGGSEGKLVTPLYQAISTLAQNVSQSVSAVELDATEYANLSQLTLLKVHTLNRLVILGTGAALAYGKLVHLKFDGTSKITAELADATNNSKPAQAVVISPNGIPVGSYGEVLLAMGYTASITGSAIGAQYYLSTAGDVQTARPTAPGSIVQGVGIGLGSAGFFLNISQLFGQN